MPLLCRTKAYLLGRSSSSPKSQTTVKYRLRNGDCDIGDSNLRLSLVGTKVVAADFESLTLADFRKTPFDPAVLQSDTEIKKQIRRLVEPLLVLFLYKYRMFCPPLSDALAFLESLRSKFLCVFIK